jgi:hypothetical protein
MQRIPRQTAIAIVGATAVLTFGAAGSRSGNRVDAPMDGAGYLRRLDLVTPRDSVPARPRAVLTFTQLTDTHVTDEESPLRTEFLDDLLGTAYRPQEGLTPHVLARMADRVRTATSPFSGRQSELVVTTGDNSDSAQRNEVRWLIDILDGTVNPDSGVPHTCGRQADAQWYHGPRGAGRYYEPDGSGLAFDDGPGYGPDSSANLRDVRRGSRTLDFPGLFEQMNLPFRSHGIGQPWYVAYGNHDGLVQGNALRSNAMPGLAAGCHKVIELPREDRDAMVQAGNAHGRDGLLQTALALMSDRVVDAVLDPTWVRHIPSDPDRVPLDRREYIAEHFRLAAPQSGTGSACPTSPPVARGTRSHPHRASDSWCSTR